MNGGRAREKLALTRFRVTMETLKMTTITIIELALTYAAGFWRGYATATHFQ